MPPISWLREERRWASFGRKAETFCEGRLQAVLSAAVVRDHHGLEAARTVVVEAMWPSSVSDGEEDGGDTHDRPAGTPGDLDEAGC
eukprot:4514471-Pyramimonas_sp.AAC.1